MERTCSMKRACVQARNDLLYFLAKDIFMAVVGVILKPWRASRAAADCSSFSNSTKAMSCRPGTRRTCHRWYRNIKESDTLKIY